MSDKIKMFVSDMDGTLLGRDFRISDKNAEAIQSLKNAGIEFVIATGRIYSDAYEICQQSQLNPYIICNNGACIFNSQQEQIYGRWLPVEGLEEIIRFMEEHHICHAVSTNHNYFVPHNWEVLLEEELERLKEKGFPVPHERNCHIKEELLAQKGVIVVPSLGNFFKEGNPCYMITVHTFDPEVIRVVREFMGQFSHLTAFFSSDHTVDIVGCDSSKGAALKYLVEMLQLDMKNVAAIGDGLNDISLLHEAGVAMAPSNAMDEVKAISEFISKSNADDGVADAIQYIATHY